MSAKNLPKIVYIISIADELHAVDSPIDYPEGAIVGVYKLQNETKVKIVKQLVNSNGIIWGS